MDIDLFPLKKYNCIHIIYQVTCWQQTCKFNHKASHSKLVCSSRGPSLTSFGMTTLFLTEQTIGFAHCRADPTTLARIVSGKTRGHLSVPYDLRASSTEGVSDSDLSAVASFLARTTASSNAQQAPCPRFGVIGCQASPTRTTLPDEAGGLTAGQSHRSTRGVRINVSSGVASMMVSRSDGQFLTSSFACCIKTAGSVIFGPAMRETTKFGPSLDKLISLIGSENFVIMNNWKVL